MSEVEVKILKQNEYNRWDEFVNESPQGTIFHTTNWLVTASKVLNENLNIYGFFEGDNLVGGCALFSRKIKGLLSKATSSCLMTPYFGLIWKEINHNKVRKEERLQRECLTKFANILDEYKCDYIDIINPPGFIDLRPFTWNGWNSEIKYTYYLNTDNIKKSTDARRSIKKAIKNEIVIDKSDDINEYYELFKETFSRQNLEPPASKELIKSIYHKLSSNNQAELWTARTSDGELAAAEIFVIDSKTPHRWTAATSTELRKTGAYSLLLDEVFTNYKNKGYETINLMAANTPQLTEFITSFNPVLVPYYTVRQSSLQYKLIKFIYNKWVR
jgi:hypothetical protein